MAVLLRKSDGSALVGDAWSALCLCARCPRPRGAMGRQKCCENADRRPGMEPNPCAVGASPLGASEAKSAHKSSCAVRGRPNRRAIHRASLACAHFRGENLMRPENAVRRPGIGPHSRRAAVLLLGASTVKFEHKSSCAVRNCPNRRAAVTGSDMPASPRRARMARAHFRGENLMRRENAVRRPRIGPNSRAVAVPSLGASTAKSEHKSSCAVRNRPNRRASVTVSDVSASPHRACMARAHLRGENLMRPENAVRRPRIGPNSRAVAVSSLGASPAECAHKTSCAVSTLRLPGRLREPPRQLRATPKYRMSPNPPPPERREKEAQTTRQHSAPNADAFGHCAFHRNNPPHPGNRPAARAARKPDGKNLMRREKPPPTPEPQPVDCVPSCCGAQ